MEILGMILLLVIYFPHVLLHYLGLGLGVFAMASALCSGLNPDYNAKKRWFKICSVTVVAAATCFLISPIVAAHAPTFRIG